MMIVEFVLWVILQFWSILGQKVKVTTWPNMVSLGRAIPLTAATESCLVYVVYCVLVCECLNDILLLIW